MTVVDQMTATDDDKKHMEQQATFEEVYRRAERLLRHFGRPDFQPGQPPGDYFVHGDFDGRREVVVFVENLAMLRADIVAGLQRLIRRFPGWQIVVTVAVREHLDDWPDMGLYIRPHEIIDGLQRQYFPKEFQSLAYEGGKKGTTPD